MPLRVGFDLDGTVADMYDALHREAIKLFGEEVLRKAAHKTRSRLPSLKPTAPRASAAARTLENQAQQKSAEPDDDATTNIPMQELHLTARQQMQLWDHVKKIENFWRRCPSSSRASSRASQRARASGGGKSSS